MAVTFSFHEVSINLTSRRKLKEFITDIFTKEKVLLKQLTYIFCTDEYLLGINRQFLNHDTYTDIITFPWSNIGEPVVGEIFISLERVRENAGIFRAPLNTELHRIMFHGALHLCGYKDKVKKDKIRMSAMEDKYLDLYFNTVSRGT